MASPRALGTELNGQRFIGRWGQVRWSGEWGGGRGGAAWQGRGAQNSPNSNSKHWFMTYGDIPSKRAHGKRGLECEKHGQVHGRKNRAKGGDDARPANSNKTPRATLVLPLNLREQTTHAFCFHGALRPQKPYGIMGRGKNEIGNESPGPPPCSHSSPAHDDPCTKLRPLVVVPLYLVLPETITTRRSPSESRSIPLSQRAL